MVILSDLLFEWQLNAHLKSGDFQLSTALKISTINS